MLPASKFALVAVVVWVLFALYEYQKLRHKYDFHRTQKPECYTDAVPSVPPEGNAQVERGRQRARAARIVIAGLAKDIGEQGARTLRDLVNRITPLFLDHRVVLFENDSKDGTRERLQDWAASDHRVVLLNCAHWGSPECKLNEAGSLYAHGFVSNYRMQRMALFRDQYLNYIREHLADFDYLLVVDTDLDGHLALDGLLHSLGEVGEHWDAMVVNGRSALPGTLGHRTFAYDGLAYVGAHAKPNSLYKPAKATLAYNRTLQMNVALTKAGSKLLPVRSAFNGCALYRIPSVLAAQYSGTEEEQQQGLPCEHIVLHRKMAENGFSKVFINPNWRLYCRLQGPDSVGELLR